jgi:outer membrane protein OmpA-like peptidoglycan-associated protein
MGFATTRTENQLQLKPLNIFYKALISAELQKGGDMKKTAVVAVAVAVLFVAGNALANKCDFYQWKPCFNAKPRVAKPAPAPAAPERVVLEGVYFDTGSARIKPESYSVLDKNVANLNKKGDLKITVEGFTDNVGRPESNVKLSDARAAAVKDYFVSKGIKSDRIGTKGYGADNPIADNKTADGRAKNRRIEIETR